MHKRQFRVSALFWMACQAIALLIIPGTTYAADVSVKRGDRVITVNVQNDAQLQTLLAWDLDIWSHHVGIGPVDVHVSEAELTRLNAAGFEYTVRNNDLFLSHADTTVEIMLRKGLRGANDFDNYKEFDEIVAFINDLAAARPDLCAPPFSIGQSIEGRDIWVLKISGADTGFTKPAVFYHGLQHCREWITGAMVLFLADHLVNNYDSDPAIQNLVDSVDFYLTPCMNPDGYVYTWPPNDVRLWRKNRRDNGDGTFGVDLNRNWAYGWGGGGSSGDTSSLTYRGPAPFSEPETQAMSNFISSLPNIVAHMDYHSYSQLILWPFGNECIAPPEPDATTFSTVGNTMQSLIQAVHGEFYQPGPICLTLYQASGGSVDWTYAAEGCLAYTIELRPDSANPGFELPPSQILPTCEENLPAILHLSEWAAAQMDTRLSLPNGLPTAMTPAVAESIDIVAFSFGESLLTGSPTLHYRYDGGTFQTAPLALINGDLYQATLPEASCGDTPEYYFSAEGSASGVVTLPASAPSELFTAQVGELVDVYATDFEVAAGWTTDTTNNPSSGFWQPGVPVNDAGWEYDPMSDADGSGQCYLTQNETGNTDVDGGGVILISPTLDLSDGNIAIRYDYYLRLTDTAGGVDRLLVEISGNDGAGPWTEIARHDTDGGLSWRSHTISQADLNAAGVTLNSTMKLRFTANDADPQSIVEAGVDGLMIDRLACGLAPCPTFPGDMNGNGTINGMDIQGYVDALLSGFDPCADLAAPFGTLDDSDTVMFITMLLSP